MPPHFPGPHLTGQAAGPPGDRAAHRGRPRPEAAAACGLTKKGAVEPVSELAMLCHSISLLLFCERSARLLLASTLSARPADTLPRLVAGLYTLSRDLTSSVHCRVPTFCGRTHRTTPPITANRGAGPHSGDAHPFRRSGQLSAVDTDAPVASTPPRRREPGR